MAPTNRHPASADGGENRTFDDAEHLRLLLQSAGEGIYSIDCEGRCTFLNRAASELLKLPPDDALGRDMHALIHHHRSDGGAFPPEECPIYHVIHSGQACTAEDIFWRTDQTSMSVRYTASPILKSGQIAGAVVSFTDISAQRRAEQALQKTDARLRFALDAAGIGAWDLDLRDGSAWRSLRHDEVFGYSGLLPEWTYERFLEHVHPDDRERVNGDFQRAVAECRDWSFEARIIRADGELRWIWARGAHHTLHEGKPNRLLGIVMDVTERRETERALNEAQVRLESALNAGEIGTWIWDVQTNRMYADANLARMFSVDSETAQGGPLGRYVAAIYSEDLERVVTLVNESLRTGDAYEADYRLVRPDGSLRWVVARGKPELDAEGKPTLFPGVVIDITERKQAEEALRNQRQWLEQLLNLAPTPVLLIEPGTARIRFANQAADELAGGEFPKALDESQYPALYQCTDANGDPIPAERMPGVLLARGERLEGYEMCWQTPAGLRSLLVHADTLPAMHGHPATGILVFQDVSEIKRMTDELRAANRTKDEFLAIVSHELRTPLNAMLGWASILRLGQPDPETYDRAVDAIERNAKAQAQIIEDILDTSRIVSGRLHLAVRPVDLAAITKAAVDSMRPSAGTKELNLDLQWKAESAVVLGDTGRLQQIIGNLLSNAIKFSDTGGTVYVRLWRERNQIHLEVRDTGQGIDPEFLPKVFERFRQADSSSSRPKGGLGLGLAITKQLLDLHGGTIHAASEGPGKGAAFTVSLPDAGAFATDQAAHTVRINALEAHASPAPSALSGLHVLAVDDVNDALQVIASVLEHYGARVSLAPSAEHALEVLHREQPDILISDIEMPGTDGYALIRRLRSSGGEVGGIPAIALTAHAGPTARERIMQAGYDAHIPKPFEPAELVSRIVELAGSTASS